jgi:hypothetical protein
MCEKCHIQTCASYSITSSAGDYKVGGHGYAELQHQGSFPSQDGFPFFWGGHQLRETPHIQRR